MEDSILEDSILEDSVSASLKSCLDSFENFNTLLKAKSLSHDTDAVPSLWEDELGRLRIWAANIGAHQSGQSSLDFRLRDASHIRQHIVELVHDLCSTIREAAEVLNQVEQSTECATLDTKEGSPTDMDQLHRDVVTIINCLFDMSMLVRKPARHNLLTGAQTAEISVIEPIDRGHVRNKYPKADPTLVQRLGLALTQRRKHLEYRKRHRAKLGRGLDTGQDLTGVESISLLSDTEATVLSMLNVGLEERSHRTEVSQESSTLSLLDDGSVTIPPPPKASIDGAWFECPYCFFMITVRDSRSWHKHLFDDLQPYVCTVLSCSVPHKLYSTRREWLRHLQTAHENEWLGIENSSTEPNVVAPDNPTVRAMCPLCSSTFESEQLFGRHLASHLLELALFVLPRGALDSDADDSDRDVDIATQDKNDVSTDSETSQDTPRSVEQEIQQERDIPKLGTSYEARSPPREEIKKEVERSNDGREARIERRPKGARLNEWFVKGEGILSEVLEAEIGTFLGPEAFSRLTSYDVGTPTY